MRGSAGDAFLASWGAGEEQLNGVICAICETWWCPRCPWLVCAAALYHSHCARTATHSQGQAGVTSSAVGKRGWPDRSVRGPFRGTPHGHLLEPSARLVASLRSCIASGGGVRALERGVRDTHGGH